MTWLQGSTHWQWTRGGFSADEIKRWATRKDLGVASHKTVDVTKEYYEGGIIRYLIFGNVLKNQTYPLSVSAERMVRHWPLRDANEIEFQQWLGSTGGAATTRIRFDMALVILAQGWRFSHLSATSVYRAKWDWLLEKEECSVQLDKAVFHQWESGEHPLAEKKLEFFRMTSKEAWPTQITKSTPESGHHLREGRTCCHQRKSFPIQSMPSKHCKLLLYRLVLARHSCWRYNWKLELKVVWAFEPRCTGDHN